MAAISSDFIDFTCLFWFHFESIWSSSSCHWRYRWLNCWNFDLYTCCKFIFQLHQILVSGFNLKILHFHSGFINVGLLHMTFKVYRALVYEKLHQCQLATVTVIRTYRMKDRKNQKHLWSINKSVWMNVNFFMKSITRKKWISKFY